MAMDSVPLPSQDSNSPSYPFYTELARTINSGQGRAILLHGDVHGLFHSNVSDRYLPLVPWLCQRVRVDGLIVLIAELNGPIRCTSDDDRRRLRDAWVQWKLGGSRDELILRGLADPSLHNRREEIENRFNEMIEQAAAQPTVALEFFRQLTICSRSQSRFRLLILVEAADFLLPGSGGDADLSRMTPADRHRISIMQDWLSDPAFNNGPDSVVMIAEAASAVSTRVTSLPQLVMIGIDPPNQEERVHFTQWFNRTHSPEAPLQMPLPEFAALTAGLSLHAMRQLLLRSAYVNQPVSVSDIISRVESYIEGTLGEGVVEFSKPAHSLEDVVGFSRLKQFLADEMIPRIRATGPAALPGAAIAGPIGSGKTFIFEAVAGSLGLPVLVLKNIRSQYFGQTDVLFEKLRSLLESLGKVIIIVDEADTQFGSVGAEAHPTERRLTGKLQQMMSDPKLRGRVVWLLMTARIELLSPDLRRPGRVGDLIIPVLDPEPRSKDHAAFLRWALRGLEGQPEADEWEALLSLTEGYSAAAFSALRSQLLARRELLDRELKPGDVHEVIGDQLPADIGQARRYQELQALLNCTRRSLLPDPDVDEQTRDTWRMELRTLSP
ncbi:MAG: ATP-binding protein [Phycisphaeraceae bacterium]|nr:ATP-binding protein [Phycisphaeraceae bacterium]